MKYPLLLLALLLPLSACTLDDKMQEWFGISIEQPATAQTMTITPPRWCYRTIGAPECYDHPVPGAEGRLIGNDPGRVPKMPIPTADGMPTEAVSDMPTDMPVEPELIAPPTAKAPAPASKPAQPSDGAAAAGAAADTKKDAARGAATDAATKTTEQNLKPTPLSHPSSKKAQ